MKINIKFLPILLLLFITLIKLSNSIKIENRNNKNNINYYNSDDKIITDTITPPPCGDLKVCLFTELNYKGKSFEYSIYSGYIDLPEYMKNNMTSFVSNADVCFITYQTAYVNQSIPAGEYLSNYYIIFGDILEGIQPGKCE